MDRKFSSEVEVKVPPVLPPGMSIRREVPMRVPEVAGDVLVPFLWAVISGMMILCVALVYCVWKGLPAWLPLLVAGSVMTVMWFVLISGWRNQWKATEDTSATTITKEPVVEPTVTVEMVEQTSASGGRHYRYTQLPISPADLKKLADGVIHQGITLSEENWCGKGNPFSKRQFKKMLACLHEAGYIAWRNEDSPTQGRDLTGRGVYLFRKIASGEPLRRLTSTIETEEPEEDEEE